MLHNFGNALSLVFKSLLNRRATAILTVASIAVSAGLLSIVDRVRTDTQTSFANTISGTDLIIGARSGDLNLLLYSVFRIGNPTNNVTWNSYETIGARPEVDWTIPISLGDAHGVIGSSGRTSAISVITGMRTAGRWRSGKAVRSLRRPRR